MNHFQDKNFLFDETIYLAPSASSFEKHMHNEYELYFFLQGNADYIVGDSLYHLQKNDLLFIRPAMYHYLKVLSPAPYRRIVVNFSKEHISEELFAATEQFQTHYRVPNGSAIEKLYENALQISERYSSEDKFTCLLKCLDLILTELKYNQTKGGENPVTFDSPMSKIIRYIDENLHLALDLDSIAQEFFVSPSWLTHAFRKHMNISVMQYVSRKKILVAQQLIANGIPPMQAAEQCGFKNYSTFYLQYKKLTGLNPARTK